MEVPVIIVQLVYYFGMNPYQINDGYCGEFAEVLEQTIPGAEANDCELDFTYGDHAWIEYKGRYYDAETPFGVDNLDDLPIFKRRRGGL